MPTPNPIMAATMLVKLGTSTTLASTSMMARPMPMPMIAVRIGRPMASTDPKAISRMTMAARVPAPSELPPVSNSAFWMAKPPSSNLTPEPAVLASPASLAAWAAAIMALASSTGKSLPWMSS